MSNTQQLGALKSKHAPSKSFIYLSIFIFVVFSAISGLIYATILEVQQKKVNFSGDISMLYWIIAAIMVLAILMVILAFTLSKGKTYELYENGVVTDDKGDRKVQLLENLEDLYLFTSGRSFVTNNIAFRNRAEGKWEVITVRYRKVMEAIDYMTTRHEEIHVPAMLKKLENGGSITFNYITQGMSIGTFIRATGTKSFLKVKPKELIVFKDHLRIDGENILISDLSKFAVNNWISKISLMNKENKVVFSTSTNGIFSGYTFVTLMDQLINR